jgi:UDP-N-acetylglucosamine--N-acetylmuramyl-(pentapeptide) pyrophosphoryl-undecaprenol N-acetylglucosamine transferase
MKILLIGGGTGGHILPLVPLARELKSKKVTVELVVADAPLDRVLAEQNFKNIPIHYFRTDKIRRYLSIKNLLAPFTILTSIHRARRFLQKIKPDAIFFKGGFVGFPFLIVARLNFRAITLFSHESDISAGALTKLAKKWCHHTFASFGTPPAPLYFSPDGKVTPGASLKKTEKPQLLVLGGSLGAQWINNAVEKECHDICKNFDVFLISGKNKKIECNDKNFRQIELLPALDLAKELHGADLILSRAGANSLFEIIAAKKPSVIVPLPSAARDHQRKNAEWFVKKGLCHVLEQDSNETLLNALLKAQNDTVMTSNLKKSTLKNAAPEIAEIIINTLKQKPSAVSHTNT